MGVLAKIVFNRQYAIYGESGLRFARGNELSIVDDVSDDPSQAHVSTFIDIDGDDVTDGVIENRYYKQRRYCTHPDHAYIIRQDRKGLASFFEPFVGFVKLLGPLDTRWKEARGILADAKKAIATAKMAKTKCKDDDLCRVDSRMGGHPVTMFVYHEKGFAPYYLPDGMKEIWKDHESVKIVMDSSALIVVYGEEAAKIWQQLNKKN